MPAYLRAPDGRLHPLPHRCLVGKGAGSHLRLRAGTVSYAHALLAWDDRWTIIDLRSKNGTRVNGRDLGNSLARVLHVGDRLTFGGDGAEWTLVAAGPPEALALRLTDGATAEAIEGTIALPAEDAPEAWVSELTPGAWWVDRGDGPEPLEDDALLILGAPWRIRLPCPGGTQLRTARLSLSEVLLELDWSEDLEHARARLHHPGGAIDLGGAVHWVLAAHLADARLTDAAPAAERGWRSVEWVTGEACVSRALMEMRASRIRHQLSSVGLREAEGVIDGRSRTNFRRLTIPWLRLVDASGSAREVDDR